MRAEERRQRPLLMVKEGLFGMILPSNMGLGLLTKLVTGR